MRESDFARRAKVLFYPASRAKETIHYSNNIKERV